LLNLIYLCISHYLFCCFCGYFISASTHKHNNSFWIFYSN